LKAEQSPGETFVVSELQDEGELLTDRSAEQTAWLAPGAPALPALHCRSAVTALPEEHVTGGFVEDPTAEHSFPVPLPPAVALQIWPPPSLAPVLQSLPPGLVLVAEHAVPLVAPPAPAEEQV